jgi:archaellum biogenesis protein FlaJ (TadC family)
MKFNFFKKKAKQASQGLADPENKSFLKPETLEDKAMQITEDNKKLKKNLKENTPEAKQEIKDHEARERLKNRFMKLKSLKDKKLFKRKKKFTIRGFARNINLQEYLEKAGIEGTDAKQATKNIFRINFVISIILNIVIIILGITFKTGVLSLLVILLGFWLTAFFLLLGIIWSIYLFYLDMKIYQRTKAVEGVFPDFLQLTSANISAGMPVDKALWYAVRPGFGVLAKEIENVAKNTMAGEDLSEALTIFSRKYDSKVIQRSISLLLEGMAAGGEMAGLLNKISLNIEEEKILQKEMSSSVTTYVIFITFATIVAAPILFALANQLLVIIKQITSRLGTSMKTSSAFFSIGFSGDTIKGSDFAIFAYLMLIISSVSSACIVSVIRKGHVKDGLKRIPIYIIVSVVLFTLASLIIRSIFKGFI